MTMISVPAAVIGIVLFQQWSLRQLELEVIRVEVDTTYDLRYRAMFTVYFFVEYHGGPKRVEFRLYKHGEHEDAAIDRRLYSMHADTTWLTMQFYKGEDETFEKNLYSLTAQITERWTDEPIADEVTVWDGETSELPVLPLKQTFGVEVTKVEIAKYSTYEMRSGVTVRNYTLRFYIINHYGAELHLRFTLYREFYTKTRVVSSEVTDSCELRAKHGEAGYLELKAGASEPHLPTLDLKNYRLRAVTLTRDPKWWSDIWYGLDEELLPVEG